MNPETEVSAMVEAPALGAHPSGTVAGEDQTSPAASTLSFPDGDAVLLRTLVYDHPSPDKTVQILVSVYTDGEVDVAMRPTAGSTWGPPWIQKEVEGWN